METHCNHTLYHFVLHFLLLVDLNRENNALGIKKCQYVVKSLATSKKRIAYLEKIQFVRKGQPLYNRQKWLIPICIIVTVTSFFVTVGLDFMRAIS